MEEYKPNSHLSKEQKKEEEQPAQKKYDKIVKGNVKVKKRSGLRRMADSFISEDAPNIAEYVIFDILIPSFKKVVSEMVVSTTDMMLWGETRSRSGRDRSPASKISYRDYYDRGRDDRDRRDRRDRHTTGYDYDDIIFDSKGEALEVLGAMEDALDRYQVVSVADLCELAGVNTKFTDNKYGWTDLSRAEVIRISHGEYVIKFPRALPID